MFISEIPYDFIKKELVRKQRAFSAPSHDHAPMKTGDRFFINDRVSKKKAPVITPISPPKPGSVAVGDRVVHKMYGKGKVRSIIRS